MSDYTKSDKLHIVVATAVIRNAKGEYLLLKRHENEVAFPGMYTFPGGKVEQNQTIDEALALEIKEETGLTMKSGKILVKDKAFTRPDGQTVKMFSYVCEVEDGEVVISEDFTDYIWLDGSKLGTVEHVGLADEIERADALCNLDIDKSVLYIKSVSDV